MQSVYSTALADWASTQMIIIKLLKTLQLRTELILGIRETIQLYKNNLYEIRIFDIR